MLPDLLPLSDDELSTLLAELEEGEDAISRRRRVLHGRIDILRAERTGRLKAQVAAGASSRHRRGHSTARVHRHRRLPTETERPAPDLASLMTIPRAEIRRFEQEEDDISLNRQRARADRHHPRRAGQAIHAGEHVDADDSIDPRRGR
jgi:hypothetical protein